MDCNCLPSTAAVQAGSARKLIKKRVAAEPLVMAVALAGIIQLGLCQLLCGAWVSADAAAAAAVHFYEP